MKELEKGHKYIIDSLDGAPQQIITFVKRYGKKYPGNSKPSYGGTNCQELLRVLCFRLHYLNSQKHDDRNIDIIEMLIDSIWLLECRAAERHKRVMPERLESVLFGPTCKKCGHIGCNGKCHKAVTP